MEEKTESEHVLVDIRDALVQFREIVVEQVELEKKSLAERFSEDRIKKWREAIKRIEHAQRATTKSDI